MANHSAGEKLVPADLNHGDTIAIKGSTDYHRSFLTIDKRGFVGSQYTCREEFHNWVKNADVEKRQVVFYSLQNTDDVNNLWPFLEAIEEPLRERGHQPSIGGLCTSASQGEICLYWVRINDFWNQTPFHHSIFTALLRIGLVASPKKIKGSFFRMKLNKVLSDGDYMKLHNGTKSGLRFIPLLFDLLDDRLSRKEMEEIDAKRNQMWVVVASQIVDKRKKAWKKWKPIPLLEEATDGNQGEAQG